MRRRGGSRRLCWRGSAAVKQAFLQSLFEGDGTLALHAAQRDADLLRHAQRAAGPRGPAVAAGVRRCHPAAPVRHRRDRGRHHQLARCPDLRASTSGSSAASRPSSSRGPRRRSPAEQSAARSSGLRAVRRGSSSASTASPGRDRARLAAPAQRRPDRAVGARPRRDPGPDHRTRRRSRWSSRWSTAGSTTPRSIEVADAGVQPVYSLRVDTDDHAFITNGFVSHNTESRLAPVWRWRCCGTSTRTPSISVPNYDGRAQEPTILPSRIPNLLVNGSRRASRSAWPPTSRRTTCGRSPQAVQWCLEHPEADEADDPRRADQDRQGPGLPDRRPDRRHQRDRGRLPHRPRLDPDARRGRGRGGPRGRTCLVVTELPYQVNPDNLAERIAELIKEGKLAGIADIRDESSGRTGMRIVHRAQARRGRQGGAEQPLQAHPAAGDLRRQHAGAGRRGAAHAEPGPVHPLLRRAPDRGHRPADRVPAAQGRGAGAHPARSGQGAGRARRGHRPDPALADASRRPAPA